MSEEFAGFGPAVFAWFAGLERDNSKAYMAATRERYESEVRGGLEAMLEELAGELGGGVKIFRQQRDLRFTKDTAPYKLRTYGLIFGGPGPGTGFYAELSAAGLYAATGYHQLERDQLGRFRDAVADDASGPALEAAAAAAVDAGLELDGESLRTAPRGFARDHPRIALLRRKALIAGRRLAPGKDGIDRGTALGHARGTWAAAEPLNAWLDDHVGQSRIVTGERFGQSRLR